jgi:hypothetical protein
MRPAARFSSSNVLEARTECVLAEMSSTGSRIFSSPACARSNLGLGISRRIQESVQLFIFICLNSGSHVRSQQDFFRFKTPIIQLHKKLDGHSAIEDLSGLCTGSILITVGLALLKSAGLMTSGISGVVLIANYLTGYQIGVIFFTINIPFYILSLAKLGWFFTLKTVMAIGLVSILTAHLPFVFELRAINSPIVGFFGGIATGIGLLALFRHGGSIGGTSILALYMQKWFGVPAWHVLILADLTIFGVAFYIIGFDKTLLSMPGAIALNLVIALNHIPGRYVASR